MKGIILKNIDLTSISSLKQLQKIFEEQSELLEAIEKESDENVIAEFFDLMQVWIGYIQKERNISADQIQARYIKHLEKIKNRPRKKDSES